MSDLIVIAYIDQQRLTTSQELVLLPIACVYLFSWDYLLSLVIACLDFVVFCFTCAGFFVRLPCYWFFFCFTDVVICFTSVFWGVFFLLHWCFFCFTSVFGFLLHWCCFFFLSLIHWCSLFYASCDVSAVQSNYHYIFIPHTQMNYKLMQG